MATIDERVVSAAFENHVFEQRVAQTLQTLAKLDAAIAKLAQAHGLGNIEAEANKVTLNKPMTAMDRLKGSLSKVGDGAAAGFGKISSEAGRISLTGMNKALDNMKAKFGLLSAGSAFTDIEKASHKVTLAGVSSAIDNVTGKFGFLQNAASVALGNITSQATMKGAAFAKSFAVGPLTQGFEEYGTNMKSIQTIMANTEGQKVSGLEATNKHLEELNLYADQTIYNFSEMAKNIGTFTAAGVDLPKATASIKGIANLAALSGSNSQQASTAMYQLSQSIAAGKVGLQDWNSVVNAGMGGAVFQKALMRTAENLGAVEKGAVKINKETGKATVNGESFRNSIMAKPGQESWLTSDVLTDTLQQLTGDMTKAELVAKGYSDEQAKAIMKQADTAKKAATEVKTLPQVWEVAREGIGSGWAKTFQLIFGDFEEAKKTFTDLSGFIGEWVEKVSGARNELVAGWKLGGGREDLIEGLKNAFTALMTIITPIKDAFRKIFPPTTVKELLDLTTRFREFTAGLALSEDTIGRIRRTMAGIFAVFNVAKTVVGGFIGVLLDLVGTVGKSSGGFFEFIADIGDYAVALNKAVTEGEGLTKFFDGLTSVLQKPVEWIQKLAGYLRNLFVGEGDGTQRIDQIKELGRTLSPLEVIVEGVKNAWNKLVGAFEKTKTALEPFFSSFVDKLSGLGQILGDALKNLDFEKVMAGAQVALTGGLFLMLKNAFGQGGGVLEALTDTLGSVQEVLGGVTGNLENMQRKVQAQLILAIAAAVLALAGGVYVLSTIDGDKLAKAMTAVAIGLGQLIGAMKIMASGLGKTGALMLPFIAAGLIGLAIAVTILGAALKIFGSMSWEEIGAGMTALAGTLATIAVAMKRMPKGPQMIVQAGALLVLGVALNAIALAIKTLGSMDLQSLGKGLFGVMEALGVLALTMGMMPPNMIVNAAALLVLSFALNVMASAIKKFGEMDFLTIVQGTLGVTAAIAGLGYALWLMPPNMIATAAGLVLVGFALIGIGKAVEIMGGIGIWGLIKGLAALAAVMVILAVGLYLMSGTLPGALALMAAAAALAVLAPTLGLLGTMKWGTIFKGLAAIALVLGTIAVVGLIAAPALAALGIALIPLGLGFMLVAGAAKIFASAMAMLSDSGQKGIAAFLVALTGFAAIIPTIIIQFIKGLVGIVEEIAKIAPKVFEALDKVLETVIQFVADNAVKLAVAVGLLIDGILLIIVENVPKIVDAGRKLLLGLLSGISADIGAITTKVAEIIIKFMDALRAKTPQLVESGAKLLRTFLEGVTSKFDEIANAVGNLIQKFGNAVGNQAHKIVGAAANMMGRFLDALGTYGPKLLAKGIEMIGNLLKGLGDQSARLIRYGVEVAGKLLKGIADGLVGLVNVAFDAMIDFLEGLELAIRENSTELINAGIGVGDAIMDGIIEAFNKGGWAVRKALEKVFKLMPGWAKKILGIKSPSKVFHEIGMYTMAGFHKGIEEGTIKSKYVMVEVGKQSAKGMAKGLDDNKDIVTKAAVGSARGMVNGMRHFLGIHSPSEVFRDIGMNVNRGFRDGLLGSKDDVISAFEEMNSTLIDKIRDLRGQVADGNTKVEDLQKQHAEKMAEIAKARSEKKPDQEEIANLIKESQELETQIGEETKAVLQNGKALTAARNIRASLTGSMHDEKMQLLALKKDYETINKELEEATATLEELQRAREDAQKKYIDQYSAKPDIDKLVTDALADADLTYAERQEKIRKAREEEEKRRRIDQVALYKQALQEQLVATQKYQATLQKLRELGLDDETYRKLLDQGLEGQEFASQLLAGGKTAVDQVKAMNAEILKQSTEMAQQAADNLYAKGIENAKIVIDGTADGLIKGLADRKADIEAAMNSLADIMVNAIKRKLKIKSPSRIFAEMGKFTTKGLAQGLNDTREVEGAVVKLGQTMTNALSAMVSDNMDTSPVITPVLDISQLKKDVAGMPAMDNVVPITAATSYGQASAASREVSASQQAALEAAAAAQAPSVSFEQNNYSPEALSDVEIYRKTKNQIGMLKSALGVPA